MIAAASGGLLGVGGGEGYLAQVAAADTDLILDCSQRMGLLVALTAILVPVFTPFMPCF